jgi:hypothetical protein
VCPFSRALTTHTRSTKWLHAKPDHPTVALLAVVPGQPRVALARVALPLPEAHGRDRKSSLSVNTIGTTRPPGLPSSSVVRSIVSVTRLQTLASARLPRLSGRETPAWSRVPLARPLLVRLRHAVSRLVALRPVATAPVVLQAPVANRPVALQAPVVLLVVARRVASTVQRPPSDQGTDRGIERKARFQHSEIGSFFILVIPYISP